MLGLDGGGTKTIAAVATLDGRVLGVGRALSANFQGVGRRAATLEIKNAVTEALEKSKTRPEDVVAAGYGIAGADRDKDFDIVAEMIVEAGPPCPFVLCNDTTLALRAGTRDGVGVATVAGTGANTMGFNKEGAHVKVGGMDFCGDSGSSYMIVQEALVAAMRAWDGRGPKTILSDIFCETFGLEEIADIIEKTFFDSYEHLRLNKYAPLVFDAARRGDRMALNVLPPRRPRDGKRHAVVLAPAFPGPRGEGPGRPGRQRLPKSAALGDDRRTP
ncbi:MAG: hypothetical protein M5R36_01580 [Deltaproteobacteria bacterium]|nr:hypothetical protein [Deltaproteobacteria bacterium]